MEITTEHMALLWTGGIDALIDDFTRAYLVNKIKLHFLPQSIADIEAWFTENEYDYNHLYSNEEFKEITLERFKDVKDPLELTKRWELIKTEYTTKYYKLQEEMAKEVVIAKELLENVEVLEMLKNLLNN